MPEYLKEVPEKEALDVMRQAKQHRETLRDNKGFTGQRTMRFVCTLPLSLYLAHPEFFDDPKCLKRFLNEHPQFRVGGGGF